MELPTLGNRCAFEECKQLDFLPFTCSHCECIFCKDHYLPDKHKCTHVENNIANIEGAVPFKHYCCSFPQCTGQDPLEMCCSVCEKHFCLQHRHHGCIDVPQESRVEERKKWEAPRKQFEVAKAEADRQINENLNRAKSKAGVSKTAIKVQLMRLKGKAVGLKSIPTTDRVYFLVYLPLALSRKSKAIYVGRNWTVGRVIDAASDLCGVSNRNNQVNSPKLRLFHHCNGLLIAEETDQKLDDLLKEGLVVDGESLIFEYLIEGSDNYLQDTSKYQE